MMRRIAVAVALVLLAGCQTPPQSLAQGASESAEDASCVVFLVLVWNGSCRGLPTEAIDALARTTVSVSQPR